MTKYSELIKEFEEKTKWKVKTNSFANQISITPLIINLLGKEAEIFLRMSLNQIENTVKISLSKEPEMLKELEDNFIKKQA